MVRFESLGGFRARYLGATSLGSSARNGSGGFEQGTHGLGISYNSVVPKQRRMMVLVNGLGLNYRVLSIRSVGGRGVGEADAAPSQIGDRQSIVRVGFFTASSAGSIFLESETLKAIFVHDAME
jgi:hypothetical protein